MTTKETADQDLNPQQAKIRAAEKAAATRLPGMKFTIEVTIPPQNGSEFDSFQSCLATAMGQSTKVINEKLREYFDKHK